MHAKRQQINVSRASTTCMHILSPIANTMPFKHSDDNDNGDNNDNDDALFEQLEAELEQDGTFDYYRDQRIRAHESTLQRRTNLATRFHCFSNEKPLLDLLSDPAARSSTEYLLVFANETFPACQHLLHALRSVVEGSSGTYIVYVVDAANAPFLARKLNVKTLPTMVPFRRGHQTAAAKVGLHGLLDDPLSVASLSEEHLQRYIEELCFPPDADSDNEE